MEHIHVPVGKALLAAGRGAFRFGKRKAFQALMNVVTPSKYLRGSDRGPDAVKTSSVAFGAQSYRVSGRKCRLKKRRVTYTDMKNVYTQLFAPLRFHIMVGPCGSAENLNLRSLALIGFNDNIPLGMVRTQMNQGLIMVKCVFPFCSGQFPPLKQIAYLQNNLINSSQLGTAGTATQYHPFQPQSQYLQPDVGNLKDNSSNAWKGPLNRRMTIGPTTVTHHLWNSGVGSVRLKVIYIQAVQDSNTNPLTLWGNDLISQQANWPVESIGTASNPYNFQTPVFLDEYHLWTGLRGGTTTLMSGPDSGLNPDANQMCALLSGQKLIEPGVGAWFKRFWRKRKSAVYTLGPNEKLSISDCIPKFTYCDADAQIPVGNVSNLSNGNVPQYRPKWAYGMIFMVQGCEVGDTSLNPVAAAQGAFGGETLTQDIVHVSHTYEFKGSIVNMAINHSNPLLKYGSLIPNAMERNSWVDVTGQVTQNPTTDNTAIPTYPLGGNTKPTSL